MNKNPGQKHHCKKAGYVREWKKIYRCLLGNWKRKTCSAKWDSGDAEHPWKLRSVFPPIQSQSLGFKVPSNCNHCMTLWPKDKSSEQTRLCNVEQSRVQTSLEFWGWCLRTSSKAQEVYGVPIYKRYRKDKLSLFIKSCFKWAPLS